MSVDLASEPISETERQKYCVEMMQRLNKQRRNEDSCDLILEVGSGDDRARLKAHRNVLCAASPLFYNALNTEMKEKKEGVIRLEKASKGLMEDVLEYLYTGHVEISERNAVDLLAMADYLIIPSISETERQQYCVEMMQRLNIQRRNEDSCDLILEVGSGDDRARLKAHRNVLCAASPLFYNALNTEMKEKKEGVIRLEKASKGLMEDVLEYLYTGHVYISERNAVDLLAMADYLIIPSLKVKSCEVISQSMSHTNCLLFYYVAMSYQCTELQERTRNFIFANFMSVTGTDDFLELSRKQVEEWISRDEIKVKSEEEVFQVIVKWMEERESGEHEEFFQLLRHVRLMHVPCNYVLSKILPHPLVKGSETCTAFARDSTITTSLKSSSRPPRNCLKRCEDGLFTIWQEKSFCYLPSENKWHEMSNLLSKKTCSCSCAVVCGKLYVSGEENRIERYDPFSNSWVSLMSNTGVDTYKNPALVNFQGSLFVVGGETSENQLVNKVQKYNPDTDLWQEVAPMSVAREGVCVVADERSMYAIGGWSRNGIADVVEKYDPQRNSWSRVASTREKKAYCCGVLVNSKVFLFGGVKRKVPAVISTLIEIYDPVSDVWTSIQNTSLRSIPVSAVSLKGDIFVVVRSKENEQKVSQVKIYSGDTNEWKLCAKAPAGAFLNSLAPLKIPRDILTTCKVVTQEQIP